MKKIIIQLFILLNVNAYGQIINLDSLPIISDSGINQQKWEIKQRENYNKKNFFRSICRAYVKKYENDQLIIAFKLYLDNITHKEIAGFIGNFNVLSPFNEYLFGFNINSYKIKGWIDDEWNFKVTNTLLPYLCERDPLKEFRAKVKKEKLKGYDLYDCKKVFKLQKVVFIDGEIINFNH